MVPTIYKHKARRDYFITEAEGRNLRAVVPKHSSVLSQQCACNPFDADRGNTLRNSWLNPE
jgi:hypothetical protein